MNMAEEWITFGFLTHDISNMHGGSLLVAQEKVATKMVDRLVNLVTNIMISGSREEGCWFGLIFGASEYEKVLMLVFILAREWGIVVTKKLHL